MPPTLRPQIMEKLLDISRQMAETRELDPLLNYAMLVSLELVEAEQGYLILVDDQNQLDFRVRLDRNGRPIEQPIQQISQSILSRVVFEEADVIIADALKDSGYQDAESVAALRLRSVMAVPLISRGRVLGALYVENRSESGVFISEDLKILKFFAGQAAVSIENAMLNDELEARVAARTAELQAANEQLQHNWHDAVEHNRIRTSFLSTIVHDIRSPLATAMNAQQLMLEGAFGDLNDDQAHWVGTSLRTLEHIIKLTDDIFDLTKLEMQKLTLHPEPVDFRTFLEQMYEIGRVLPWQAAVDFQLKIYDNLPPTVNIDKTRIQQVLMNLISNAHKFTAEGAVVLYAGGVDDGVVFGVRDTGAGVHKRDLPHIFERYKQSGTRQMRQQGTGLGLAIVQEIVNLHNGKITVQSQPDVGSDFHVWLPI
ncbi:MAG: sensor histidine kinase [Anaerolineaceae bacterium]|nr:MAG: sensor histidine kinase [Anaerolineaceae bacterium]